MRKKFPSFSIQAAGKVSQAFIELGWQDFESAARYVRNLNYGQNSDPSNYLYVLQEKRGNCSTKHALLAALAEEQRQPVYLTTGIIEVNESLVPGVNRVLAKHGLSAVPETHSYLTFAGQRFDLTRLDYPIDPRFKFIAEARISPQSFSKEISAFYRKYLEGWANQKKLPKSLTLEKLDRIRLECTQYY